jgi:hypothetical protein
MFLGNPDAVSEPQDTDCPAVAEACGAQTCGGDYSSEPDATLSTEASAAQDRCVRASAWTG